MLIFAKRYSRSVKSSPRYVRKRNYKNFSSEEFSEAVKQVSWLELYLCNSVDRAVDILTGKLTFILDTLAPMKTYQVRTRYAPWLSKCTVALMKERDAQQKKASETDSREDWQKFKTLRNTINNRLKFEETNWQKSKLEQCGEDSAKIWKHIKGILNWKTSGSPNQLFYQGRLISKPIELAEAQNEYFIEKINLIRQNLPQPPTDPLSTLRSLMVGRTCTFELAPVHPDEVEKILSSLSNSNSFGLDMIDTYTIKLVKADILPALTHIINLSITTKTFPASWKRSKVIPLHKKEDLLNPKNYRPVAIIPIFSKVLERVIFNQMVAYITDNSLIHPNHHAYRAGHNTTTALLQMYDVWLDSLEKGEMAGVCFLDMSAAFDIVDHSLLLKKLSMYGFESDMVDWISSYLSDRVQCVSIDGCVSKLQHVQHGVPQGSILGPLLYILFTNELPEVIHDNCETAVTRDEDEEQPWPKYTMLCKTCGSIGCYADDTTYTCSGSNAEAMSVQLSSKYKLMSDFLISNKLKLNDDKTHLMVMSTSQARTIRRGGIKDSNKVEIRTPSEVVHPSECEKLLGCMVHQDMKFGEHLISNEESLLRALNTRIGALKILSKLASFKTRKMVADGIFMSKLIYLIPLWGGSAKNIIASLQKAQNRAARVVTKLDWATHTGELLKQCGWMSVHQMVIYHSVVLVQKIIKTSSPKFLFSMFSAKYTYNTKQAQKGLIKHTRDIDLGITEDSFRWRASKDYNGLPMEIRSSETIESFKKECKTWILNNIPLAPP